MFLYAYGVTVTSVVLMSFAVSFVFYRDYSMLAERRGVKSKNSFVSILIAVHNEEEVIAQCIESMLAQTYSNREIIFVNDASTDGTLKILNRYKNRPGFTIIDLKKNVGKKRALAEGVYRSKGEVLAFSDSDSVWAEDAIERVVKIFDGYPDVGAVSGHTRALNADKNFLTKVQDSWYEGQYSIRKAFESVFGAVTCVSGPLAVFRREAIYGFMPAWEQDRFMGQEFRFATDRTLTGYVLGAQYIGKKTRKKYSDPRFAITAHSDKDWRVVYCKSANAWTMVPDNFKTVMKQQVRWKKSFIRNIFFTGRFYWKKPVPVALVYYLHILFVFAGPFVAFRHILYLPFHGHYFSMILYLAGIVFVGLMFGLAVKLEDPESRHWVYRPFMSLLSTLVLTWTIFYSAITIRKMTWHRG